MNGTIFDREKIVRAHVRWLEQFNPVRGLTMTRVTQLLEEGTEGNFVELQWLNRMVERRDGLALALKRRRKAAQRKLDWTIKTVPEPDLPQGSTKAEAEAQRVYLQECYNAIVNLNEAVEWLMLADFRGYAHLEIHESAKGEIERLQPVPQWHFTRDGIYGDWRFHLSPAPGVDYRGGGEEIDPARWIFRETSDPAYELFLVNFMRKQMAWKDWDGFLCTYGIPWFFFVMPPGIPAAKEAEFYEVAQAVANDGRGVLPNGTEVKSADAGLRGQNPFTDYLRNLNEEMVLAGTGGILTMLTAPGSGTLAGSAHAEAWSEIVGGEAQVVAEMLREEIDAPCLEKRFGEGVTRLAYFDLSEPDERDPDAFVDRVMKLGQAGYAVDQAAIEDGAGVKLEALPETRENEGEDEDEGEQENEDDAAARDPRVRAERLRQRGPQGHNQPGQSANPADRLRNRALMNAANVAGTVEALMLTEATLAGALGAQRTMLDPVRARLLTTIERAQARGPEVPVTEDEAATLLQTLERELGDLIPSGEEGRTLALDGLVQALESGLGTAAVLGLRDRLRERRKLEMEREEM